MHHRIEAGRLTLTPESGLDGTACKKSAVIGFVGYLDPLAVCRKDHRVIADDAASTQRSETDLARLAGPCVAIPTTGAASES